MAQLRQDYAEFESRNTRILIVGPENTDAFQDYFSKHELPFTGLPDPDASVLKLYGQEIKLFKFGRLPAQVIVDRAGVVRFVHYGHSMDDIPENSEVLALLDEINTTSGE